MSDWDYAHGYPGGPMVPVDGFPRPLYPPDAAAYGKTPSRDSVDVIAYKRTVSRAGRWAWQPFDDSYSNAFAHGKPPGNVAETGVAGVQRQQQIDATGWLGKSTFNALRSILIPQGLPHAGEHAMDSTAADLINEAFALFGGHEPAPPETTVRASALARARAEIGTTEDPAGSNVNPYGAWYGQNAQPWCAMFLTWSFELGAGDLGRDSPSFVRGSRYAFVPYLVADARSQRYGLRTTDDPIPGDLVCYDWNFDGEYDHIGTFDRWVSPSSFDAIEGNTSPTDAGSQSNGGMVCRRTRTLGNQACVFVRVSEP